MNSQANNKNAEAPLYLFAVSILSLHFVAEDSADAVSVGLG
jgi:hypothetical protein